MTPRQFRISATAITVVAAGLRFWALDLGLPHLMARPDDESVLLMTGRVAQGHWDLDWAVYPSAWVYLCWAWGVVCLHAGEWLGALPPSHGYFEVLTTAPERVLLLERGLSALLGTAAVAALMALGRRPLGAEGALLAGWVLATNFLHVRDSHSLKPDAALSLAVVVALAAAVALADGATRARAVRAGLALGGATAIKYPGVLLAMPIWLGAVFGTRARGWRRLMPASAVVALFVGAGVFAATSPFLVVNDRMWAFLVGIAHVVLPGVFGEPVVNAANMPASLAWLAHATFGYHLVFSSRYGAGLVVTAMVGIAVLWGLADRRPTLRLAAAFALFYYLVVGLSPVRLARYLTPLMPVVALLVAGLVTVVVAAVVSERRRAVAMACAAVLLTLEPLAASIAHNRLAARPDTRVLATRWLTEHAEPGTRLAFAGTRLWVWGRPQIPAGMTGIDIEPTSVALSGAAADYLVTHDHVLFSSHVDAVALATLAPRLQLAADFDPTCGTAAAAVFEAADAYYLPIAGFAAVCRGGPHVRIYHVVADAGGGS
jgi:4-amino-4-deoxy-L-arabinose transferase-like glycosyltransferase